MEILLDPFWGIFLLIIFILISVFFVNLAREFLPLIWRKMRRAGRDGHHHKDVKEDHGGILIRLIPWLIPLVIIVTFLAAFTCFVYTASNWQDMNHQYGWDGWCSFFADPPG